MSGSSVFFGQADADDSPGAGLWQLASGVDDAGVQFGIYALSNWVAPAAGGGTCVFYDAYVTVTWTTGATLRFKPILDQWEDIETWNTDHTIETVVTDVTFADTDDGQRTTKTFRIPLMRRVLDASDNELTRNQLVGTRIRLEVQSVGDLGGGDLILDGAEIEFEQQVDDKPQEGTG